MRSRALNCDVCEQKKTKTHNHAPHPLPIILQRHVVFNTSTTHNPLCTLSAPQQSRTFSFFFLHRAQLFTCASIAVYSFCTTHAPSTQSFHINRAIINIASLPTGAIIAHRPNLRIPIMHTMAARQCLSIAFDGEMSAFSKPQKRAHRRNARRFVAAALVLHRDRTHCVETHQATLHFLSISTCTAQSAPTNKTQQQQKCTIAAL